MRNSRKVFYYTKGYCIYELFHNPISNVVRNIMKPKKKPRSTPAVISMIVKIRKGKGFQQCSILYFNNFFRSSGPFFVYLFFKVIDRLHSIYNKPKVYFDLHFNLMSTVKLSLSVIIIFYHGYIF